MDILFGITVAMIALITYSFVLYTDRQKEKTTFIYGTLFFTLAWFAILFALHARIKTGEYPFAILRFLGLEQMIRVTSDLGMDDLGRQLWCEDADRAFSENSDRGRIRCEKLHRTTFVVEIKNYGLSLSFKSADTPEEVVNTMREQPYSDALQDFKSLTISGDKSSGTMDNPVPTSEIKTRLEKLGAKNLADLYTAMGFREYLLRDPKEDYVYLKLTFSRDRYGHNPVKVETDGRFEPMCRYVCKKGSVVPEDLAQTTMYTFYLDSPQLSKEICQCGIEKVGNTR